MLSLSSFTPLRELFMHRLVPFITFTRCAALATTLATSVALLSACSETTSSSGGAHMQLHLQRVGGLSGSAQRNASFTPRFDIAGGTPSAPHWSSDVNIISLKVPVFSIVIQSDDNTRSATLYSCAAETNDGCLVELTGGALQDLIDANPVTVDQGTYTHASIQTCHSSSYTSYITASVVLDGQTYYTKSDGTLSTTAPAQALGLPYSGCGRNYNLPTPAVVSDTAGAVIPFTMYFDIRDIAWAAVGGSDVQEAWLPGGCSGVHPDNSATEAFICTGYPDVAGIAGSSAPALERYRINGGATLGLFFTSDSDLPIGGYTRRFFTEGVNTTAGFSADTPVDTLEKNLDGTLHIATFGGGSDGSSLSAPYFSVQSFARHAGSGTLKAIGVEHAYTAVKLP